MSKLTPDDYQLFSNLRMPSEFVDRNEIFRVDRDTAEAFYGIHLDCNGALVYPFYLPPLNGNDTTHPVYYRARQDRPPQDAHGKEQRKYLGPPGPARYPYFPPAIPVSWYADKTIPVIVVEAQKSALSILRWCLDHGRKMIPVAISGCRSWSGKVGIEPNANGEREEVRDILPLLEEVCRGRRVYILFDANESSNVQVRDGRDKLVARLLDGITSDIRLLRLPPAIKERWNGPDDFIRVNGDEAFFDLFETAEPQSAGHEVQEASEQQLVIPDLPDVCLDGTLGELCREYMSAFPRALSWPALLAHAAALIQDRAEGVRTNLYSVLVGKTHSGKTQAMKWAAGLLNVPESSTISAFSGSGEQFVHLCADAAGNARLFAPDELGHLMEKMAIERASFAYVLNRGFDADKFPVSMASRGKEKNQPIFNCHLSICGGVVTSMFEDLFGITTAGGFYDRCLFGYGPTGVSYQYRGAFPERLRGVGFRIPGAVEIHPSVWGQFTEWRKQDPELGRILEIGLRAATICAAYDRRPVIKAEDLAPMKALVDYQKSIRFILRPNEGATIEGKITDSMLRYMDKLPPGKGVTERTLFTNTHAYRLSVRTAQGVLRILLANGALKQTKGSRSTLLYKA